MEGQSHPEEKSPLTLFSDFYRLQNNQPMSQPQTDYISDLIRQIWEEDAL